MHTVRYPRGTLGFVGKVERERSVKRTASVITLRYRSAVTLAAVLVVTACTDDSQPIAYSTVHRTLEEAPVVGYLSAWDREGDGLGFFVDGARNGRVGLDPNTGRFEFQPDADFFGEASFTFHVRANGLNSLSAKVSIVVENVNDPPRIAAIPDLENSAYTEEVVYQVVVTDPDPGPPPVVSAAADDPDVVDVVVDSETRQLSLRAKELGVTTIDVVASDSSASDAVTFTFAAEKLERMHVLHAFNPSTNAVTVTNVSDQTVTFGLEHNGFPVFETIDDIVGYVHEMPEEETAEPFERKLWRLLRDSTNHYYPLMPLQFRHAPWATLNSLGFGFCGDMATSYVAIAKAAGYEARVWSLFDPVVPEILVEGRWQLYDPDIGIYYYDRVGRVAGVEELAADASLVREPMTPILPTDAWAYSSVVTDIYATSTNNILADHALLPTVNDVAGTFVLPAGATLTFPGRWSDVPVAYVAFGTVIRRESDVERWRAIAERYDGAVPRPIPFHRQAKIDVPDGWAGEVSLPLWLWEVTGSGVVSIDGVAYAVGSPELTERLRYSAWPPRSIEIVSSANLSLIMEINFVRQSMRDLNELRLRGLNVWALHAGVSDLGQHGAGAEWRHGRPRPK